MPAQADLIYKTKSVIVQDLVTALLARVPTAHAEEDGVLRMVFEIFAGEVEGIYLATQIMRDNIFVQTANHPELKLHGEQYGLALKTGTPSVGSLRISGLGGTLAPAGTQFGSDPGTGDVLIFETTADATLPNPGLPTAPTAVDNGGAGNIIAGTYEYVITFTTALGETEPGAESTPVVLAASHKIDLSAIPLGGAGTVGRKIYRSQNGGDYKLVTTISNNTATTYQDNIIDASLGSGPPVISTAETVDVAAQSDDVGLKYNVLIGAINEVIDAPDGITDVTNPAIFSGGTEEEDLEAFRARLLEFIRDPHTGSVSDLQTWAEEISGVAEATAFTNDNLGTPTNGHTTVRIIGPDGTIPDAGVIADVLANLVYKDIANISIHVATFTAVTTNVTVVITLQSGFVLADVTAAIQEAIIDYINSVPVGGSVYIAGIYDAVFGLAGVKTLSVTTPATDQTATNLQKRTPGTISVT